MRETSKVFNRIPLLALVNNRTRQNDGRISLQKQTSNDKRQSNLTTRGIEIPASRETFAQRKLYVILKIIPLEIYIRYLVEF